MKSQASLTKLLRSDPVSVSHTLPIDNTFPQVFNDPTFQIDANRGAVVGFERSFQSRDPANAGSDVNVLALRFPSDAGARSFLNEVVGKAPILIGLPFSVVGVPAAYGLGERELFSVAMIEYLVYVGRGRTAFLISASRPDTTLNAAFASFVTRLQVERAVGPFEGPPAPVPFQLKIRPPSTSPLTYLVPLAAIGGGFGLYLFLRARRQVLTAPIALAAPTSSPDAPGWYPNATNPVVLEYWDGTRWTWRGTNTPTGWVQHPHD